MMLTTRIDNALLRGTDFPCPLSFIDARFAPIIDGSLTRYSDPNNISMCVVRCTRAALSPEALAQEKATEAAEATRTSLTGSAFAAWSQFDENDTRHLHVFQANQIGFFTFTSTTMLSAYLAKTTELQSLQTNDFPGFQGIVGPNTPLSVRMLTDEAVVLVFDSRINVGIAGITTVTVNCPDIFQFKYTSFGSNDIVLF
jgi:hypothetical protein